MVTKKDLIIALAMMSAITMFLVAGCGKTDNPASSGDTKTGPLVASPTSVSLLVGRTSIVTLSGGKVPYSVQSNSDTTKVRSRISGTTLTVTGLALGTANIVVKDSAGASTVSVPVTVASMIASPNSVTVATGSISTVTISGGTAPYSIQTGPTSLVATATISGAILSVTGVTAGSTRVVVKDNSSPAKTVTLPITVKAFSGGFTIAGTLSFISNKGDFSANGIYDPTATSGTGAGAMIRSSGGINTLTIYGLRINSATNVDITLIQFVDTAPLAIGTFAFTPTTSLKSVSISYAPATNPSDTTAPNFYLLTSATASISVLSSSDAEGTFSGSGVSYVNAIPDFSQSINVTAGSFKVPVIPISGSVNTANKNIESIVKRIVSLQKQ